MSKRAICMVVKDGRATMLDSEGEEVISGDLRDIDKRNDPQWLHWHADQLKNVGFCYFIGGDVGRIKIGFSLEPERRLATFQPASPIDLCILATAPGGRKRERAYHKQFAIHHEGNEWFARCPEILEEIAILNNGRRLLRA